MRSKTMCFGLALIAFMSGFRFHGSMTTSSDQAYAQTTGSLPLVQLSNLVYQGAFRVPQGSTDQTFFFYGGTVPAYNPAKNSLFMVGHNWYQRSAEISIPIIINS